MSTKTNITQHHHHFVIQHICRERREQEQRERDRLDKERAERERREREERERKEREVREKERKMVEMQRAKDERERQAVEADVNRHFELSIELARKVRRLGRSGPTRDG